MKSYVDGRIFKRSDDRFVDRRLGLVADIGWLGKSLAVIGRARVKHLNLFCAELLHVNDMDAPCAVGRDVNLCRFAYAVRYLHRLREIRAAVN